MSTGKRPHKSHRKTSSGAKSYTEPPVTFLFSVIELPLNHAAKPRQEAETGLFLPPVQRSGFSTPDLGDLYLYRWSNGKVSWAERNNAERKYAWADNQWQNSATASALEIHRATGTFWCNPLFMTSTCDPTIYDMETQEHPANRWWPLTFEHEGSVSRVQESAESHHLSGRGNQWITDCGLAHLLVPAARNSPDSSALAGNIGAIIGLIALSCPAGQLSAVLLTDQAWNRGHWEGHQRGPGRTGEPRGVVVTIYLDPENPSSTREILRGIESTGGALLG